MASQPQSQSERAAELYEDDFTEVTIARKNRRKDGPFDSQKVITYLTLGVAVIAIIVGAVAISKADESNKKSDERQQKNNENLAATREMAELSTGASTILSTVPFCSETPQNRQACINLIAAGEKMIADVSNTSVTDADILSKFNSVDAYSVDSTIPGLAATTDFAGSNTQAKAVVTDDEGHVLGPDGKPVVDGNGNAIESPLFDVDKCLFTYKHKLCFALVPVGDTVEADRKRRSTGGSKYDLVKGTYIPVIHASMSGFIRDRKGRMARGKGGRSAAIMGCLGGMGVGATGGGKMGGAVGTLFGPGPGTAIGGAIGALAGGALGCAAGGGWLGRRR